MKRNNAIITLDNPNIEGSITIEFDADANIEGWKDVLRTLTEYMTYKRIDGLEFEK